MLNRIIESIFYSEDSKNCYRVVKSGTNSCVDCCFCEWGDSREKECNKPSDAGFCSSEERDDGNDIIFEDIYSNNIIKFFKKEKQENTSRIHQKYWNWQMKLSCY